MWLLVDVAGTCSITELHSEEDAGHTHLEVGGRGGGGGQGLSCVDTSHFMLPPGVCGGDFLSCARQEEDQNIGENVWSSLLDAFSSLIHRTTITKPFLSIASHPHTLSCWLTMVAHWCAM